jgi:hypothetical protein
MIIIGTPFGKVWSANYRRLAKLGTRAKASGAVDSITN